jgi:hypothetical protein
MPRRRGRFFGSGVGPLGDATDEASSGIKRFGAALTGNKKTPQTCEVCRVQVAPGATVCINGHPQNPRAGGLKGCGASTGALLILTLAPLACLRRRR